MSSAPSNIATEKSQSVVSVTPMTASPPWYTLPGAVVERYRRYPVPSAMMRSTANAAPGIRVRFARAARGMPTR